MPVLPLPLLLPLNARPHGRSGRAWYPAARVCILLAGSVTTGNSLNLSVPHLLQAGNNSPKLTGLFEDSVRQGLWRPWKDLAQMAAKPVFHRL